jgi:hypothetical protein
MFPFFALDIRRGSGLPERAKPIDLTWAVADCRYQLDINDEEHAKIAFQTSEPDPCSM